jgi:hypothetical protein
MRSVQFSRIAFLTCLINCQGIKFSKCEGVLQASKMLRSSFLELVGQTTEHVSVFQQHHLYLQITEVAVSVLHPITKS